MVLDELKKRRKEKNQDDEWELNTNFKPSLQEVEDKSHIYWNIYDKEYVAQRSSSSPFYLSIYTNVNSYLN